VHVVLLCGYYYPDTVGGTEAYVRMLGRDLTEAGHDVSARDAHAMGRHTLRRRASPRPLQRLSLAAGRLPSPSGVGGRVRFVGRYVSGTTFIPSQHGVSDEMRSMQEATARTRSSHEPGASLFVGFIRLFTEVKGVTFSSMPPVNFPVL
jgi:hypothetical protein